MKLEIPESLRLREQAICAALRRAVQAGGKTADAADILEAILLPHLAKERADVLQPLGLLLPLARGRFAPEMAEVLPQIEQLKHESRTLRIEHATILSAIKRLVTAAREEGKLQHARFAERLLFRAWLDESVFFPLAILIGKYLQLRLQPAANPAPAPDKSPGSIEFAVPESLQFSHEHEQLSSALSHTAAVDDRTKTAAEPLAQLLEAHLRREDTEVLRVLGLLAPLASEDIGCVDQAKLRSLDQLESSESALHLEHTALIAAGEKLLVVAREEGADEVGDFAERLLLRVRLDEEIFYPAALLIRNYLRLKRAPQSPGVTSFGKNR